MKPPEQRKAVGALARSAKTVIDYVEKFRGNLTDQVLNDIGYSYRVFLVPKVANRNNAADAAIEFVHLDEADEKEKERLNKINVLIKDRHVPIANLDNRKPTEVVKEVAEKLPFIFSMYHHTMAWRHFNVRPRNNSETPHYTNQSFCIYDRAHKDYLYTKAWTEKLIRELKNPNRFKKITQKDPRKLVSFP